MPTPFVDGCSRFCVGGTPCRSTVSNASYREGASSVQTLLKGIRPQLSDTPVDRLIDGGIIAADAYESITGLFQQGFDAVRWGLVRKGGAAGLQDLLLDDRLRRHIEKTMGRLNRLRMDLTKTIENVRVVGPLDGPKSSIRW